MVSTIVAPLFVPASRPERFPKAAASGADAVILDLEDAVGAGDKTAARANLDAGFTDLPVVVRVNAPGNPWHEADPEALRDRGFAAVMLPKSEVPASISQVGGELSGLPLIALIENARGLANSRQIADVRRAFVPSAAEVLCAERVLASGDSAVSVDGQMVDDPVRSRARAIMAAISKDGS